MEIKQIEECLSVVTFCRNDVVDNPLNFMCEVPMLNGRPYSLSTLLGALAQDIAGEAPLLDLVT